MISTNLAKLGFFPSKKHDSVGIRNFLIETFIQKSQKIENNDTIINNIFPFFAYFSKTIDFWHSSRCRNEFSMQKYPNKHNFIGFEKQQPLIVEFLLRL